MSPLSSLLLPVVALVAWSHVMWAWMYATRLPAMRRARIRLDPTAPRGQQVSELPPQVRWKADNYNNLMEQPTCFYAVVIALALAGSSAGLDVTLAWAYVGLRVVHSLVHVIVNKIELRFVLFVVSSLVLVALTVRAILVLLASG